MDEIQGSVGSLPASREAREGPVLREDRVREIVSRLERGEGIKTISRELGVHGADRSRPAPAARAPAASTAGKISWPGLRSGRPRSPMCASTARPTCGPSIASPPSDSLRLAHGRRTASSTCDTASCLPMRSYRLRPAASRCRFASWARRCTCTRRIYHREAAPIACHAKSGRHAVVMEPGHYAGLLRPGTRPAEPRPPRFDPVFLALGGEVTIRGLDTYAVAAGQGGVR
jgi:hypothetical protein